MKIRNLDYDGDFSYGHSISDYLIDNGQAVGLNIVTRLREWYKDCFFNLEAGIDYPTRLGSFNQKNLLDDDFQRIIRESQGVVDIIDFTSNLDTKTRHYTFQAQVRHIYSTEILPVIFTTEGLING